jgi:hypothetical protein
MAIQNILRKLMNKEEGTDEYGRKISANETELEWYRKKEYEKRVKAELDGYRERERDQIWKGKSMKDDENQIIKAKNVFKGQKNVFRPKKSF